MAEDPLRVPLPEQLPVRLDYLQELYGAANDALELIEALRGRNDPAYQRLDDAVGQISDGILRHLGFWDQE